MLSSECRRSQLYDYTVNGSSKIAAQTGKLMKKFSYRRDARGKSCAVCRLRNN